MNWEFKFENLQDEIETLSKKAKDLAQAYAEAEDFTLDFLDCCKKHHIKLVSIGTKTDLIECSRTYPFDPKDSVFSDERDLDRFPAIWSAVRDFGIDGGCGNDGQHQITHAGKLVDGIYEYKSRKWHKIG